MMVKERPNLSNIMLPNDFDVAKLLYKAFGDVRPNDEFVSSVAERLDAEFHVLHNASSQDISSKDTS